MYTQDNILLTLSYLLGERTVPTQNVDSRKKFIQDSLKEAHQAYRWKFANVITTATFDSQAIALATTFDPQHSLRISYGTDYSNLEEIDASDEVFFQDGSRRFWLVNDGDGSYTIRTNDTDIVEVKLDYQDQAPAINATIATAYPNDMTIALGARRWVKFAQNPDADISSDETLFQKRLGEDIAANQIAQPRKVRKTAQTRGGHATGDF